MKHNTLAYSCRKVLGTGNDTREAEGEDEALYSLSHSRQKLLMIGQMVKSHTEMYQKENLW